MRLTASAALACCLCLLLSAFAQAQDSAPKSLAETYLALPTRPGVTLPVLLLAPERPLATVVLLAGGNGAIGITGQDGKAVVQKGGNFLVRSRQLFASHGLAVAVVDAPSDHADGLGGMSAGFRFSAEHVEDLRLLALELARRYGSKPWLVGTSMGTLSAAYAGANLGPQELGGVVLTSTITKAAKKWELRPGRERAVLDAGLGMIRVPALVVRHADDGCAFSAPKYGPDLLEGLTAAPRKALLTFEGGLPAQSDACEAKAAHGYFGVEDRAVAGIAAFILNEKASGPKP